MATTDNHFDANALLRAMERPTLTVPPRREGGRPITFTGGFISLPQWAMVRDRLDLYRQGTLPVEHLRELIRDLTDLIFGRPPWWAPWRPCASVELLRLPLSVQLRALQSFTESQVTALRLSETPPTPGTTEPQATTAA